MERILVSMDTRQGAWEALSRAISLARRIDARVYALLVIPPEDQAGNKLADQGTTTNVRKRLELQIEFAKSEGVRIDYFIAEGDYEEEVIQFVDQNRISLLVVEPPEGENRHSDRDCTPIRKIRHRIACRVELVSPRKNEQISTGKGIGNEHSTSSLSANRRK